MAIKERIVAEVTKNWPSANPILLSQMFETAIVTNRKRGYQLESWQMARVSVAEDNEETHINETIVAVFVKCGRAK